MILDTNFVSGLIDEDPDTFSKATEINDTSETNKVTPVVLFELYYGAFADENSDLVRRVTNIAAIYEIANMGEEEVKEGALRLAMADIKEGGESGVEIPDAMIGGVAACRNEKVVTGNVDDFEKLGVDIEEFQS